MGKGRDKELIKLRDEAMPSLLLLDRNTAVAVRRCFKSVVGARILYIRGTYHDHHPPEIT